MTYNKDQLRKLVPIMEAWIKGKEIEVSLQGSSGSQWKKCLAPEWNPAYEYRVKPEPRVVWMLFRNDVPVDLLYGPDVIESSLKEKGYTCMVETA